jgi:hypothetical protein
MEGSARVRHLELLQYFGLRAVSERAGGPNHVICCDLGGQGMKGSAAKGGRGEDQKRLGEKVLKGVTEVHAVGRE